MAILSKGTTYADGDQITSTNLNALVDNATFDANAVSNGVGLNGSGQLEVVGNIDIGTSNLTATGAISLGATTFNDNNITNVGSIAVDTIIADDTDITIDAAGDIILDAGGADILLKDDGTQFGSITKSGSDIVVASSIADIILDAVGDIILDADGAQVRIKDAGTERFVFNTDSTPELDVTGTSFTIHANTSDADMFFRGNDGGSDITALKLDMSSSGDATFNNKVIATELDIGGDVDVAGTTNLDVVDIDGAVNMATTALVTGVLTTTATQVATGGITSGSSILSDTDSTDSLGSTAVRWLKGWFDTLTAGTLTIGSGSVTDSSGAISFGNENLTTTGNVGIGTASPIQKLSIEGSSSDTIDETTGNLKLQGAGGNGLLFGTQSSSPFRSYIQAAYVVDTSLAQYDLLLNPIGGNVGISNTSPSSTLDVTGTLAVSGDAAFDTDTLFVDVSADRVGINDSTPSVALDVTGEFNLSSHATLGSNLSLKKDTDAWSSETWLNVSDYGVINTGGSFALTINGNGYRGTAGWTSFGKGSEDGATQIWQYPEGYITFNANNNWGTTTDGSNKVVTERMRLNGDTGNLGIGTTSPDEKLDVVGAGRFSTGVTFGTDTAAANKLDDYEEGTWTPVITFGGASVGVAYSTPRLGTYTKIGRLVTATCSFLLSDKGSSTGHAVITGLPFASSSASGNNTPPFIRVGDISFADFPMGLNGPGLTTVTLFEAANSGTVSTITEGNFSNSSQIQMAISYAA